VSKTHDTGLVNDFCLTLSVLLIIASITDSKCDCAPMRVSYIRQISSPTFARVRHSVTLRDLQSRVVAGQKQLQEARMTLAGRWPFELLFVDHDLAQDSAEEPRPTVGDTPSLDIDVATVQQTGALDVKARFEQCLVETRHETTRLIRVFDRFRSTAWLRVDIDDQLVEIQGVVAVLCGPRFTCKLIQTRRLITRSMHWQGSNSVPLVCESGELTSL